jgi:hypothetical protein
MHDNLGELLATVDDLDEQDRGHLLIATEQIVHVTNHLMSLNYQETRPDIGLALATYAAPPG